MFNLTHMYAHSVAKPNQRRKWIWDWWVCTFWTVGCHHRQFFHHRTYRTLFSVLYYILSIL